LFTVAPGVKLLMVRLDWAARACTLRIRSGSPCRRQDGLQRLELLLQERDLALELAELLRRDLEGADLLVEGSSLAVFSSRSTTASDQ